MVLGCLSSGGLFSDRLRITSRSESSCRETVFSGGRSLSSWPSCWRRPGPRRNGRPGGSAFSRSSGSPGSSWRRQAGLSIRPPSSGGGTPTTPMRPTVFVEGAYIAASGGFIAIARRHRHVGLAGARGQERRDLWLGALGRPTREIRRPGCSARRRRARLPMPAHYLRHDGPEHVLCFAPTRSGKGVGLVVPTLLTWPGQLHRPRHQGRELGS